MAPAEIQDLLTYLQKLEHGWNFDPHVKDIVHRIKLKIDILISQWKIEHEISVQQNVIQEYQQSAGTGSLHLPGDGYWESSLAAAKLVIPDTEKLRFINPEMKEMYSTVFEFSRSFADENENDKEVVVSFINLTLENLKDILSSKAGILVPVKPHILSLQEELRFLRNFLSFLSQFAIEKYLHRQDLYGFAEAVAVNTAFLLLFLRVDKKMSQAMEYRIKVEVLELVDRLKPLQQPNLGEIYLGALEGINRGLLNLPVIDYECILRFFDSLVDNLMELLKVAYLEPAVMDQIKNLHEEVSSLRFYLMDLPLHDSNEILDSFMFKIQELTVQLGCFFYSCICKKNHLLTLSIGGLLEKIEQVKNEPDHLIIPRSWQSNFPKTNALGYIDFIIKNLEERPSISAPIDDRLRSQFNTVYEGLVAVRDDFRELSKLQNDNEKLKAALERYRDVAYQTEYLIDSSLCGVVSFWYQRMGLINLGKEIRHVKEEVKAILMDHSIGNNPSLLSLKTNARDIDTVLVLSSEKEVQKVNHQDDSQLVGLEDEVEKIRYQITGGPENLTILSIVGMPGLGKSTLANSLYRDPSVTIHFHARAWCTVSQTYNKETLLLEIFDQVQPKAEDGKKKDESPEQQVYKSLRGRKYLVIMDDIWDIGAWDDLRPSFPNDNNGSRIIFTTRNQNIAVRANCVCHPLRLLSEEESLKLLLLKVFKEEITCPSELLQVGKRIAENCKGLPLTVVLTAGLLRITERTKESWEHFTNVVISHEIDFPREQQLGILELSYRHLPDHLRPCFLYFGAFPEDAEIPAWKLVRLWIAEGFVLPKVASGSNFSPENEAKGYLNDLIDRSLVMIGKRSYNGGVKTCRIHDLLRDFCTDKAQEENFLLKIIKSGASLSTLTDHQLQEQFRLCIHSNTLRIPGVRMGHFESRIRSLWFSQSDNLHLNNNADSIRGTAVRGMASTRLFSPPSTSRFVYHKMLKGADILFKFRLVKVLDLGNLSIVNQGCLDIILQLVHLRYLSILGFIKTIPREIENLKNLETLVLKLKGENGYISFPETIWNMVNLKHIQVNPGVTFSHDAVTFENCCSKLEGLTWLSTLFVRNYEELEKIVRKLPNLKKLKWISLYFSWEDSSWRHRDLSSVPDSFQQLEELSSFKHCIVFPGLRKLSVSYNQLSWDEISEIGRLPNLEVLKLWKVDVYGEQWDMKEGEFKKLKFLKLERFYIRIWNASAESLPCLEKLVLRVCYDLEEIPFGFGDIPFLRTIEVTYCNIYVEDSAKQIRDQQYEMGNDHFKLYLSENQRGIGDLDG